MKLKTISLELFTVRCLEQDFEVAPLSDAIVSTIKESFETRRSCSALSVCFDGTDYWLFDGYHRLEAMRQAGFNTCQVVIYRGSRRDAFRRYIKDKLRCKGRSSIGTFRHCLRVLIEDPEWTALDCHALSALFGRKPAFFEKLDLVKIEEKRGQLVTFSINKHGSINLLKRKT